MANVPSQPVEPRAGPRSRSDYLWAAAALLVLVGAFPGWRVPGGGILDGDWVIALNAKPLGTFGRGVVFTYGPFGLLLYPALATPHVVLALGLRLVALAGLASWVVLRGSTTDRVIFVVAQILAVRLGLTFEYQLLIPLVLFVARSLEDPERSEGVWAAFAALALFVKFSLGIAACAIVAAACAARLVRDRLRAVRGLALAAGIGVVALLVGASIGLARASDVFSWFSRNVELAAGYADAMSSANEVAGQGIFTLSAAGCVAVLLGLGLWGTLRGSSAGRVALLVAAPAFFAFKHAFVRADVWHVTLFFPFVLAIAAGAGLLARSTTERFLCRLAVGIAAVGSLVVASSYRALPGNPIPALARSISAMDGAANLRGWLDLDARRDEVANQLARYTPRGLGAALGGRTVGVVPFRIGVCAAPRVSCTPNPTFQTFAAYTAALDAWASEHYLGPDAPPYVFLHWEGFDSRWPGFDTPALFRTLLAAYASIPGQTGTMLLLERRSSAAAPRLAEVGHMTLPAGEWVPVPDLPGPLYASIGLDPTLLGRLRRAAFRTEPIFLGLEYPDGSRTHIRLVPDTARNGLPIDYFPRAEQDLPRFFEGGLLRRPSRLALTGAGLDGIRTPITLTWLQSTAGDALQTEATR